MNNKAYVRGRMRVAPREGRPAIPLGLYCLKFLKTPNVSVSDYSDKNEISSNRKTVYAALAKPITRHGVLLGEAYYTPRGAVTTLDIRKTVCAALAKPITRHGVL
ncbi:hypothetical protein J6590_024827 [Homalodisca vitripennis]|nr:hypothetical protein J6590_024827 [Homalodisca vitripennis]